MNNSFIEQINTLLKSIKEKEEETTYFQNIAERLTIKTRNMRKQQETLKGDSQKLKNLLKEVVKIKKNTKLSYPRRYKKLINLINSITEE